MDGIIAQLSQLPIDGQPLSIFFENALVGRVKRRLY